MSIAVSCSMKRQRSLGEFCLAKRKNLESQEERHEQREQDEADLLSDGEQMLDPPAVVGAEVEAIMGDSHEREKGFCAGQCCSDDKKPYQPRSKEILGLFVKKNRKFLLVWYDKYDWLTLCITMKKVFCAYCRYAHRHDLLNFSRKGEDAFMVSGFDNYKKAIEKFRTHENSDSHLEAMMKFQALNNPSIVTQLSTQVANAQMSRRAGLLKQLEGMKFLLRQGLALRGHREEEGNLPQLIAMMSSSNSDISSWIKEGKYMSHDIVNELISLMGQGVLRQILAKILKCVPSWYAVIADKATDVSFSEQFNLSIRYVDDDYVINEDSIGLFKLPDTKAETLFSVLKDMLTRCSLPLSLCRGQAYDGAATMQGRRKGLATLFRNEVPAALPVHCLAHSLNLCLQDAGRQIHLLRDALDLIREVVKLINYSPKRKHLFFTKLLQDNTSRSGIKPLCPTRWMVRTEAIGAVLSHYVTVIETMEEVHP